jgi:hypothetical protein
VEKGSDPIFSEGQYLGRNRLNSRPWTDNCLNIKPARPRGRQTALGGSVNIGTRY